MQTVKNGCFKRAEIVKIEGMNPVKINFVALKAQPAHYQEYAVIASANDVIVTIRHNPLVRGCLTTELHPKS